MGCYQRGQGEGRACRCQPCSKDSLPPSLLPSLPPFHLFSFFPSFLPSLFLLQVVSGSAPPSSVTSTCPSASISSTWQTTAPRYGLYHFASGLAASMRLAGSQGWRQNPLSVPFLHLKALSGRTAFPPVPPSAPPGFFTSLLSFLARLSFSCLPLRKTSPVLFLPLSPLASLWILETPHHGASGHFRVD